MARFLFLFLCLVFFWGNAEASSTFTNLPAANQPLGNAGTSGPTYVPMDQGDGCAFNTSPCQTVQSDALRIGQPIQTNCAAISAPWQYQLCIDTSFNPNILKEYIGTKWWPLLTLDPSSGPFPLIPGFNLFSVSVTADYVIGPNDNSRAFNNIGAAAPLTITLPTVANHNGWIDCFTVDASHQITVQPQVTDNIVLGTTAGSVGSPLTSTTLNSSVCLIADNGNSWVALSAQDGIWAVGGTMVVGSFTAPLSPSLGGTGCSGCVPASHVSTNAALAASMTAIYPQGVWRDDYSTGLGAPPLWFQPETGTCVANGRVNDGGSCTDTTSGDNNSFYAVFPATTRFEEWGASGVADSRAAINAAILVSCQIGGPKIVPPTNAVYTISTLTPGKNYAIQDHCGAGVPANPTRIPGPFPNDPPIAPFTVKWTGGNQSIPFYLADIGLDAISTEPYTSGVWQGVLWNCNSAQGCGGSLVRSVTYSNFSMGAWEPRPAPRTTTASSASQNLLNVTSATGIETGMSVEEWTATTANGASSAAQNVLNVSSTSGLATGMVVLSGYIPANATISSISPGVSVTLSQPIGHAFSGGEAVAFSHFPRGTQVRSVSGNVVTLTANIQAAFSGGETVYFGGEGIRFDVTPNPAYQTNLTHGNIIRLMAENTGSGVQAPGIFLGATNVSLTHASDFADNVEVESLECSFIFTGGACLILGYGDHNIIKSIDGGGQTTQASWGANAVFTGQLSGSIDGTAVYYQIGQWSANIAYQGTENGFAAQNRILGVEISDLVSAEALAGVTTAALGTSNHGILWRLDGVGQVYNQWLLNDQNYTTGAGTLTGIGQLSGYSGLVNSATGITSSSPCQMLGLAAQVGGPNMIPHVSGRISVTYTGPIVLTGGSGSGAVQLRVGTGSAPANGAAATGVVISGDPSVAIGTSQFAISGTANLASAAASDGQFVWGDLCVESNTGGSITNGGGGTMTMNELN